MATAGSYAPAIFAQSVGGGGGLIDSSNPGHSHYLLIGPAGGAGTSSGVNVTVSNGSSISAFGAGSAGIVAESDAQCCSATSVGQIIISIADASSAVLGGTPDANTSSSNPDTAAIYLLGGNNNSIVNYGTVSALGHPTPSNPIPSYAVVAAGNAHNLTNIDNYGTMTGNITFAGNAIVNVHNRPSGMLNAAIINLDGGQLVNEGGMLVGGAGTVGRTTLTGNLIQSGTGKLVIDLAPGTSAADRLQVNGAAVLGGKIEPVVDGATSLKPGSQTRSGIVVATGGLALTGSEIVSSTPALRYSLSSSDSHSLDLGYSVDYSGLQALQAAGLSSPNRREVGRALNSILLAGDPGELGPFAARLLNVQTPQAYAATLDSVSADTVADVQQTVFEAQQAFSTTVLRQILNESPPGGAGLASYATAGLTPTAGPRVHTQDMRAWVAGFGGFDELSGKDQQGTLHTQIAGGMLGIDKWFGADRMAGIAIGGGTTNFTVPDRSGQGTITSFNVAAYGLQRVGHAYLAGLFDYGNFSGDTQRFGLGGATGLAGTARTSVSSNLLGGRIEAGWEAAVGRVRLTPFAALELDHLWQAPLTGTPGTGPGSSNLALHFDSQGQTSIPLTLGARAAHDFRIGGHVLNLTGELGWVHEFNPQRQLTAAFTVAPDFPFRILGTSASQDSALTAVGAKLSLTRNVAMSANLSGRFSGVESAVGAFGGVQVTW